MLVQAKSCVSSHVLLLTGGFRTCHTINKVHGIANDIKYICRGNLKLYFCQDQNSNVSHCVHRLFLSAPLTWVLALREFQSSPFFEAETWLERFSSEKDFR